MSMNKSQHLLVKSINRAHKLNNSHNILLRAIARGIKIWNRIVFSCDVGISADIPSDCVFHHCGLGVVIGNGASFGSGCQVYSNVVVGSKEKHGRNGANPAIGNDVILGANSVLLGNIVVGDNAIIAAGSVVLNDVPPRTVVAGNPAIVKKYISD